MADDTARRLLPFEAAALDLVADELERLKPEALPARRDKLVAIIRHGAAWHRAYLAAQSKDEEPSESPRCHECDPSFGCFDDGSVCQKAEPPAPPLICPGFKSAPFPTLTDTGWEHHCIRCGFPLSRHVQPTEEPPPVVHPSESIPKR